MSDRPQTEQDDAVQRRIWEQRCPDLLAECERLRAALTEVHEFHCGCDRPGDPAICVATPREDFAALAIARIDRFRPGISEAELMGEQ